MRNTAEQQENGFSLLSVSLIFLIIGLLGVSVIKLVPLYQGAWAVERALADVVDQPDLAQASETQIKQKILNRLYLDYVTAVEKEDIEIMRDGSIKVHYQATARIFGDLDFMLSSEKMAIVD